MRKRGRFGWISRSFCKPHGLSFPAKAPIEPPIVHSSSQASHQRITGRKTPRTPRKKLITSILGECLMGTQTDPLGYSYPPINIPDISGRLKYRARQNPTNLVRVGVIGYGYWGPNVVRNLQSLENCQLVTICDKNSDSLQRASRTYPEVELTMAFPEHLSSPQIDALAGVTPVWTHLHRANSAC